MEKSTSTPQERPNKTAEPEVRSRIRPLLKAAGIGLLALTADCATTPKTPKAVAKVEQKVISKSGTETYSVTKKSKSKLEGIRAACKKLGGIKFAVFKDNFSYEITQVGPLEFKIRYWEKGSDPEKTREIPFSEPNPKKSRLTGMRTAIGELGISSAKLRELYDYEVVHIRGSQYKVRLAIKGKLVKTVPKPRKKKKRQEPEQRVLDNITVNHLALVSMTSQEVRRKYDAMEKKYGERKNFNLFALGIGQFRLELIILEQDLMMGNVKGAINLPKNQLRQRAQEDTEKAIETALDESGLLSDKERSDNQRARNAVREQVGILGNDDLDVFGTSGNASATPETTSDKPDYLTRDEYQVILLLNEARTNPAGFARKHLRSKKSQAAIECYDEMLKTAPMQPMVPSEGLFESAKSWAKKAGKKGKVGHKNIKRIWKFGGTGRIAENCAYGIMNPLETVLGLLIDDKVPGRGHRKNILNPEFGCVGVSEMPHKSWTVNSVQNFSSGCEESEKR